MSPRQVAFVAGLLFVLAASIAFTQKVPLAEDDLHDPSNPATRILQEPMEALGILPLAGGGNGVDWVQAVRTGVISPRHSVRGDEENEVLDLDILMRETLPMAMVLFPHKGHTEWMSCEMCHDAIFKAQTGANPVNMGAILEGEYCGVCHGAVAFPLTECDRCHSVQPANQRRAPRSGAVIRRPEPEQ